MRQAKYTTIYVQQQHAHFRTMQLLILSHIDKTQTKVHLHDGEINVLESSEYMDDKCTA